MQITFCLVWDYHKYTPMTAFELPLPVMTYQKPRIVMGEGGIFADQGDQRLFWDSNICDLVPKSLHREGNQGEMALCLISIIFPSMLDYSCWAETRVTEESLGRSFLLPYHRPLMREVAQWRNMVVENWALSFGNREVNSFLNVIRFC